MSTRFKGVAPPLIIGQAPARGNDGKLPFAGSSGAKLARMAGVGESGDDLPAHFDMVNLMSLYPGKKSNSKKGDDFDLAEAKQIADLLLVTLQNDPPRWVLLMGRNVAAAFGEPDRAYFDPWRVQAHRFVVFPHPSGVNRWYNSPTNTDRATYFIQHVLHG